MAVVGGGIEHSADRAKLLLEERAKRSSLPHEVFPIDSPIESFEFEKAILDGLGRIYEDILDKARTWLAGFVARRKQQIQRERAQVAQGQLQQAAISREAAYYSHQIPVN